MRYIAYIAVIVILFSIVVSVSVYEPDTVPVEAALSINDRVISKDEYRRLLSRRSISSNKEKSFVKTLITRELLIQEARRLAIDKEENFRQSVQSYYEQSLIKLLIEKKTESLEVEVEERMVDRYIELINKKLNLTVYVFDTLDAAQKKDFVNGETQLTLFRYLSVDIRSAVLNLEPGDYSSPIIVKPTITSELVYVVRLNEIKDAMVVKKTHYNREKVKSLIARYLREQAINDWIVRLRKSADIMVRVEN